MSRLFLLYCFVCVCYYYLLHINGRRHHHIPDQYRKEDKNIRKRKKKKRKQKNHQLIARVMFFVSFGCHQLFYYNFCWLSVVVVMVVMFSILQQRKTMRWIVKIYIYADFHHVYIFFFVKQNKICKKRSKRG